MTMSVSQLVEAGSMAVGEQRTRRLPVSWPTVAMLVIFISYADGFWVTSVQRAIGAIEQNQTPLATWLRDSTLMLVPFALAVLAALALTRRWAGHGRREVVQLAMATLLAVVITSSVGAAEVATMSVRDYRLQVNELGVTHSTHGPTVAAAPATAVPGKRGACSALCAARHETLVVHVRATLYAGIVVLVTNLVLVVWVLAIRGGRLWAPRRPTSTVKREF